MLKTHLLVTMLILSHAAHAEVVLDGSLGSIGSLEGPNFAIEAHLGQQRGNNLFHSFDRFNLNQHESATFSGPKTIQHVISRVTGGQMSLINGLLRSTIPNADMYFLNPCSRFCRYGYKYIIIFQYTCKVTSCTARENNTSHLTLVSGHHCT